MDLRIIATARSAMSEAAFRETAETALNTFVDADRLSPDAVARFIERLRYVAVDASDPSHFTALAEAVGPQTGDTAIFLSTAPQLFEPTIAGLAAAGLAGEFVRIGLEKPLGTDLASSRVINDAVAAVFPESRTYRIDHYLGKETVQNLLALRFGNGLFEPLWNAGGIDNIQITVAETVGLGGACGLL